MTSWHAEHAWLGDEVAADVLLEADGPRFASVTPGVGRPPPDAVRLPGLTLPGLANAHSHAFHRALRGRTHAARGTFWTWRERMYAVAERLDPASYRALATAVYAEMALAGITCVGEFHYVHHQPDGTPYEEPNALGEALIAAASDAGIRITLLDACYLTGGIGRPLEGVQLRFGDGTAASWARRVDALRTGGHARAGAAIHSVRAVPRDRLGTVAGWAWRNRTPLHVHLSEQPAENEECRAAYGTSPTRLLLGAGALGPRTVAVHATHLDAADIALLGALGIGVCMCPTTERDLADGIGPARELAAAGVELSLGSDQHAMIDLFEEARAMELDERLRTGVRGHWSAGALLAAATTGGHAALGWPQAGRLEPGAYADLVTLGFGSVRLAGAPPGAEAAVFAAAAADVRSVVVSGRQIVQDGRHLLVGDVPAALRDTIAEVAG
ncbi:formimidoylglutamate deiminase [Actinomadura craniellae]|uniref:Formimidoylglutamate deiminase n=1 Tax=Actinomadura craniellae TaxID=2231787 RepID=A0A365H375_9ACTN|nr:formimidoylglutamate deiminase [Actinomadura craniellae]RAY13499.1 formimidoylglutamate deiminase [Actinomadura craniellae]